MLPASCMHLHTSVSKEIYITSHVMCRINDSISINIHGHMQVDMVTFTLIIFNSYMTGRERSICQPIIIKKKPNSHILPKIHSDAK